MIASTATGKDRNRLCANARTQAMVVLAKRHPQEFSEVLDEVRERLGLPPVSPRPGRRST